MANSKRPSKNNYVDLPEIVETFADGIHIISVDAAMARITLTVGRAVPGQKGEAPREIQTTALRLVMPLSSFLELFGQLRQITSQLEQRGLLLSHGSEASGAA